MALSRVGCSPKVSNDINTSFGESIVHASFAKQSREPHLWIGKPTIHHRQEAYWRGHQVGAACGRGVSDIRRAIASRPQLTAGEVSQGGIKKPQRLEWAVAAVNAYSQSRLDSPLAVCTVSRREVPVKFVPPNPRPSQRMPTQRRAWDQAHLGPV